MSRLRDPFLLVILLTSLALGVSRSHARTGLGRRLGVLCDAGAEHPERGHG
ncbi:MAG: hypothetical protein MZV64_59005 [Ignavibacteriales bacterium]|nr:hypothetical protein [Ignavibacteriales bacterium]